MQYWPCKIENREWKRERQRVQREKENVPLKGAGNSIFSETEDSSACSKVSRSASGDN